METFHTLAEVAVGFAGFASIAVLFRRRDRGEWSSYDALRYRAMLFNSLFACAFALLPTLVMPLQLQSSILWASCSGLLLVYVVWRSVSVFPSARRGGAPLNRVIPILAIVTILLQVANIVGIPLNRGPALYLLGVGALIFMAGYNFFHLVSVAAPRTD